MKDKRRVAAEKIGKVINQQKLKSWEAMCSLSMVLLAQELAMNQKVDWNRLVSDTWEGQSKEWHEWVRDNICIAYPFVKQHFPHPPHEKPLGKK